MIFDIENSLWKLYFNTFLRTVQWFPLSMLLVFGTKILLFRTQPACFAKSKYSLFKYIGKACLSSRFREGQIELRHWQKGIRGAWRGWYRGRRRRVLPDLASQHFTHAPICRGPVVPIWTTFHVSIPTLNYLARPQLSLHNWWKLFLKK